MYDQEEIIQYIVDKLADRLVDQNSSRRFDAAVSDLIQVNPGASGREKATCVALPESQRIISDEDEEMEDATRDSQGFSQKAKPSAMT